MLTLWLLSLACAPPDTRPLYQGLLCDDACDNAALAAAFSTWSEEALILPNSRFEVWEAGRPRVDVCVPSRWGGNVQQQKNAFLQEAARAIQAGEVRVDPACSRHRAEDMAVRLERWGATPMELTLDAPAEWAVLCDRSSSMVESACTVEALTALRERWRTTAALGGRLTIQSVGQRREDAQVLADYRDDAARSPIAQLAARLTSPQVPRPAEILATPAPAGSALAEAIDLAVARNHPGQIVILSDLRQFTPRSSAHPGFDFEREIAPPDDFIAWARSTSVFPDLQGAAIHACGLHHLPSPDAARFSAAQSDALTATWTAYFQAAGVGSLTLLPDCSSLGA